jgi:tetratricopeptide (TPR) repeat protein
MRVLFRRRFIGETRSRPAPSRLGSPGRGGSGSCQRFTRLVHDGRAVSFSVPVLGGERNGPWALAGVALTLLLFAAAGALAADSPPPLVLELSPADIVTVQPESVVKACSAMLTKKETPEADRAAAYERRAAALMTLRRFEEAKQDLEELCRLRPEDYAARCNLALTLGILGSDKEAITLLMEVTHAASDYAPAYDALARQLFRVRPGERIAGGTGPSYDALARSLIASREDDLAKALEYVNKAITLDKRFTEGYYTRALIYFHLYRYEESLEDFSRYIAVMPLSTRGGVETPYGLRGTVLLYLHRYSEALPNFVMARRLNPSSYPTLEGLMHCYVALGKTALACHIAEEMVRLTPNNSLSHVAASEAYRAVGRAEDALEAARRAVSLAPQDIKVICNLGNCYYRMADYEGALEQFGKLPEQNPEDFYGRLAKSHVLACCPAAKYRDGPKARELLRPLLTSSSPSVQLAATIGMARAEAECGDFKEAIRLTKKALEQAGPEYSERGRLELQLKLFEEGKPLRDEPKEAPGK